jgi:glycerol uptake facilitator-like aquaporin
MIDQWLAMAVDAISWFLWNPALGTICGAFFGRAVVALIVELLP